MLLLGYKPFEFADCFESEPQIQNFSTLFMHFIT